MALPTLVLLHGFPFDASMWEEVRKCLPQQLTVLCPDQRWVGDPASLPSAPSLNFLADDLARSLEQPAFVAGFSMGGYVALALAEQHPDKLSGLALINSQAAADSEEVRANRRTMIGRIQKEGSETAARASLPKLFTQPNIAHDQFALRGAERAGIAGLTWALEAMAGRPDRTRVFQEFSCPVAVLHSTEDQIVPVARARQLASCRPHTFYREISGAGHASPLENPRAVGAALLASSEARSI